MLDSLNAKDTNLVSLTIDGKEVRVPKGTNLIEAARLAGTQIPHYCYHPHLSVAGNCRMCQVQVQGMPKMTIACNTVATEGMVVRTQESSPEAAEAQKSYFRVFVN
jgi:NADH-quinone oxidoreductase subunit G